jgi:hypothetical protein
VVAALLYEEKLTDGQIDEQREGRTDMTKLIGEFRDYANAPKM